MSDPMEQQVIGGRYRVLSAIGRGGMGTVWLCEDLTLRREVAVKQVGLLPGESVTDSARALREARSTAALSHRNVVTVFDVVEEGGHVWLVMENVPSRSLSALIAEDGALPPERVAQIGADVAAGLAAAHAAGITHRDVKPGNVLVRDDGVAKISDFGIARSVADPALTQTGFVTGTPTYFSPELARGAAPGPAADVWALGATLYAAVEGHPPYRAQDNPVAVLHEIATRRPDRPVRAGVLEQPLMRMLDPDPGSRWDMADAAHALRRLADRGTPDSTRTSTTAVPDALPDGPGEQGATEQGATRRRRGLVAVLVAVALLLVVAGIAYAVTAGGGNDRPSAAGTDTPTPRSTPSKRPSQATTPSRTPSPAPSSSAPASTPASTPPSTPAPAPAASSKAAFLRDYFSTVPGDLDTGWSMLGPHEQQVGRSSYDGFWSSKRDVSVSSISSSPGSAPVTATVTYVADDGRTTVERQRFTLIRSDAGRWLIDDDAVLSSRGG